MGQPEDSVGGVSEHSPSSSTESLNFKPIKTWRGLVWDTLELPIEERKLLFKVDAIVLTFASLGYFLKNLDQSNVNNAFLSGMKEDLGMYGNQLVTSVSIWTVGYVVGQLELGWGVATLGCFGVKSFKSLYALRFLVGLFESGFYPGIHYLLGSWYTPREIGKRAMIFWLAGSLGTMFSGFLQAAAYTNLDGVGGHAGWRWLFIIDAIITLPIAALGFFFLPNLPRQSEKTWWISQEEHELSIRRLQAVGRAGKEPWTRAKIKRLATSWKTYMLPMLYIIWNNGSAQPAMGYWLKSFNTKPYPVPGKHYTVPQINNLPLPTTGIFVVVALIQAWIADGPLKGRRWPFIYFGAVLTLLFSVLLRQMPLYSNMNGRIAVYWLGNLGGAAGPLIFSWVNELCSDDSEQRALLIAAGNDLAYVVQAVAPNFIWKTTDFPAAKKGYLWSIILQILLILWTGLIQLIIRREKQAAKKRATHEAEFGDRSPSAATPDDNDKLPNSEERPALPEL